MKCPNCKAEMILRYYRSAEEELKDALRWIPIELIKTGLVLQEVLGNCPRMVTNPTPSNDTFLPDVI
jgi:hypothetical protein